MATPDAPYPRRTVSIDAIKGVLTARAYAAAGGSSPVRGAAVQRELLASLWRELLPEELPPPPLRGL